MRRSGLFLPSVLVLLAMLCLSGQRETSRALSIEPGASNIGCVGDCGNDGAVTVNDLVTGVGIILGNLSLTQCSVFDVNGDGQLAISELVRAVGKAVDGCFDATLELTNLPGAVDVVFDSWGIPHIFGPDALSVFFMQGYQTANVRFWQMDGFRRLGEGRLSELFGGLTLGTDIEMRTIFTARDGRRVHDALWERLQNEAPEVAERVQAYTDGVNAWLADLRAGGNGVTLPPEYRFFLVNLEPGELDDWRPQDSVAIACLQSFNLSFGLSGEIAAAERLLALPEALRLDVFRSAPATDATILPVDAAAGMGRPSGQRLPSATSLPPLSVMRSVRAMLERGAALSPLARHQAGSNNWVVSSDLSETGHAMLANDPHLALLNPAIWHMVQLDAGPELRVSGVMFPGLAGVILGFNDYGAWGATVAVYDVTDVYVETVTTPPDYPASPRTVLFRGEQIPVLRIEEPIRVKGGETVAAIIEVVPHHGPQVPDPDLGDDVEGLAATNMSVRWTGHEITLDFPFLVALNGARNVEEFKAAIRQFSVGAQNWVWADVHGDVAYFPFALVPQRPAGSVPYLPLPGTGEAEWLTDEAGNTLWLPEEKFPQAVNPPEGFLATANNDQFGNTLDNDPLNDDVYLSFTTALGFRQQRIQDLLSNRANTRPPGDRISADQMVVYQYDAVSLEASRLLPFLFEAAEQQSDLVTSEMADTLDRLRMWGEEKEGSPAWDMVSGVEPAEERDDVPPRALPVTAEERADAVAASVYAAWVTRLGRLVFADDFAGTGIGVPGGSDATKALLHILEDIGRTDPGFVVHTEGPSGESTLWDNRDTPEIETRDEMLLQALADASIFLETEFQSSNPKDWLWGKIHQVRFQHFFGLAGLPTFDLAPFPAPGGRFTVNPAGFSLNSDAFTFSAGPSVRFVTVLDPNGIRAVYSLPGSNNGNPGSLDFGVYNRINPEIHYGDLIPRWVNGETFEYRVSRQAVVADTQRHLRFVPATP